MRRFIECLIPVTVCNLKCSYCYIIKQNRRTQKCAELKYEPSHIGKSLSVKRLGGVSFISICGAGETLMQSEIVLIVLEILKQGHFVNITTNGTISDKFNKIVNDIPEEFLKKLHFSFSFHYNELLRTNNIESFFKNIELVRKSGCSFFVQVNLCDEYADKLETINNVVLKRTGILPQYAVTREEQGAEFKFFSSKPDYDYKKIGMKMNSSLFDFGIKNFMVKRKEFCYAGDWSGTLDLSTGILTSCYGSGIYQNIFKNFNDPIKFLAIGNNCNFKYCFNSTHFMSLGIIPSIDTPSYASLRNKNHSECYSKDVDIFLSKKLNGENREYGYFKKKSVNIRYKVTKLLSAFSVLKKLILKLEG